MAVLSKPSVWLRGGDSHRATAAAFKLGAKVHKKSGGANEQLREAVRLSRVLLKAE